jgi:hypothetical protein
MASTSDLSEVAETEIGRLRAAAGRIASAPDADALRTANSEASRAQKNAESAIRKLEAEARAMPPSQRRVLSGTIEKVRPGDCRSRTSPLGWERRVNGRWRHGGGSSLLASSRY